MQKYNYFIVSPEIHTYVREPSLKVLMMFISNGSSGSLGIRFLGINNVSITKII